MSLTFGKNGILSDEQLRSFLGRGRLIKTVSVRDRVDLSPKMLATLSEFEDQFKIEHLHVSSTTPYCPAISHLVACFLGKGHKSLKSIEYSGCLENECELLDTFVDLLPRCPNLNGVTLGRFDDVDRSFSPEEDDENRVIRALRNLNPESLRLVDFAWINAQDLAAVFNSAREHSIRSLHMENTRDEFVRFWFYGFCRKLEPPAAEAITSIQLLNLKMTDWTDVFASLPTMMPNLSRMTVNETLDTDHTAVHSSPRYCAKAYATAIGEFLHNCLERENRIHVQVILVGCREFVQSLWEYLNLVEIKQSGTKRLEGGNGWKRMITNHRATIDLHVRDID